MYNEELKERFLESVTESEHTRAVYRGIFRITEKFEIEAGLDVCEMDSVTGKKTAESLLNLSGASVEKRLTLLKQYVRWCVKNNVPGAALGFLDVRPTPPYNRMRDKMVSGARMLRDYLNIVFDPPEENTVHNLYRCYLWLAFMGAPYDRIAEIRRSDVDLAARTVTVYGEILSIPDEAIPEFRNCANLERFGIRDSGKELIRYPGGMLLNGTNDSVNPVNIRVKVSTLEKKACDEGWTKRRLSYNNTRLSGIFSRAMRDEMTGVKPDFSEAAQKLEAEDARTGAVPKEETRAYRISERERGLRQDYRRWKLVFLV